MSAQDHNPPAFPAGWPEAGYEPHYGMTLRDWFAGQALNAIITATSAGQHNPIREGRDTEAGMAHDAYSLADAMLAERQKALAAAALKARGV